VSGPFFFAWVDSNEIVFDATHLREDEQIVTARIEQAEGEFAALTVEIRNPRVALLAPARKTWAWFSYDGGAGATPLFFGRLQGIPNDIHREIITLVFIARPTDFNYQKAALAQALRVAPYWDPVFVTADQRDNPDAVLEARTEMWHIDRTSHIVSTSDLLVGEDGLEAFGADEVPYDSVGITIKEAPLQSIDVVATVNWTQQANGSIAVYNNAAFPTLPTAGLKELWPTTNTNLGGGWTVAHGEARANTDNLQPVTVSTTVKTSWPDGLSEIFNNPAGSATLTYTISEVPNSAAAETRIRLLFDATFQHSSDGNVSASAKGIDVFSPTVYGTLSLSYAASRDRIEQLQFTLRSDVQPVVTLSGDDATPVLAIAGTDVGLPLDSGGVTIPVGDVARRSYFSTDRGLQSLEYALLVARAALVLRARAVEVTFTCLFSRAITLSLRKNAQLTDPRIPNGSAVGKIIRYVLLMDGRNGDIHGEITMACAIGTGGAIVTSTGAPTYVEEGYVARGYQFYENEIIAAGTNDVGYTVPMDAPTDDGITFPLTNPFMPGGDPVVSHVRSLGNGIYTDVGPLVPPQIPFNPNPPLGNTLPSLPDNEKITTAWLNAVEARLDFTLRPVTGSKFNTAYNLELTTLKIPAQINLGGL
jgi:hypothetical protein